LQPVGEHGRLRAAAREAGEHFKRPALVVGETIGHRFPLSKFKRASPLARTPSVPKGHERTFITLGKKTDDMRPRLKRSIAKVRPGNEPSRTLQ
jgi:hypothetical protein